GKRETGHGKRKRPAVQFDPAANGSHVSRVPSPVSRLHVVGRGVEEGDPLAIDRELARRWLVSFLRDEVVVRRGFENGLVGLSGGVDVARTAFLAAEGRGRGNVMGRRLPRRTPRP